MVDKQFNIPKLPLIITKFLIYRITNSIDALVTNTPVSPGQMTTVRSSGGTAEITVSRPTVDTIMNNGVQVKSQNTTVNLPPGLAMQIFGSGLGDGNARFAVTTFSNQDGTFPPHDSLSIGTNLVDISLLNQSGIVPVFNLNRNNRVTIELQINVSMQRYKVYFDIILYIIDTNSIFQLLRTSCNCFNVLSLSSPQILLMEGKYVPFGM